MDEKDELVKADIEKLYRELPKLSEMFNIHCRVGEGTFSTVYLATSKAAKHKKFALKHIVPTCHPDRIKFELQCLRNMGDVNNVVGLKLCLRERNTVVFVMPYQPHEAFCDYVGKMDVTEVREYMKNLLVAIAHVHKFNIIHRDVKPSNFLYDRVNRKYLLVDFGLAQKGKDGMNLRGVKRKHTESENKDDVTQQSKRPLLENAPKKIVSPKTAHHSKENKPKHLGLQETQLRITKLQPPKNPDNKSCKCYGKPTTCTVCLTRKQLYATRAGTPGFRPPEVLLKSQEQTTAVDVWATGVIFLSILGNCTSFFASPDDITALSEIITVFGDEAVRKVAMLCGCHLICSEEKPGLDIRKLCCLLRNRGDFQVEQNGALCCNCRHTTCLCVNSNQSVDVKDVFPNSAYELLRCLLDVNPNSRITAEDALKHKFFEN